MPLTALLPKAMPIDPHGCCRRLLPTQTVQHLASTVPRPRLSFPGWDTPLVPPSLGLSRWRSRRETNLLGHCFPRAQRPCCSASIQRPCFNPGVTSSRWKAGFHLGPTVTIRLEGPVPPGPRDAVERIPPCPPGASEVAKHLECASLLALSKSPTAPGDLPPHPCFPQTAGWVADPTTLPIRGPGSTPGRAGCTRTGGLGLKTAKLCLQSSLPSAAAEVAGGGQKTETRLGSVDSSQKAATQFVQPSTFARFVPVSAAGTLRDQAFFVGLPLAGAQISEVRPFSRRTVCVFRLPNVILAMCRRHTGTGLDSNAVE